MTRQLSDRYGPRWYLHYDGVPPVDDDNDYYWTGVQWAVDRSLDDDQNETQIRHGDLNV